MTASAQGHLGHPPAGRSPRPTAHLGDPERLEAFTQSCPDGYDLGGGPAGAAGTEAGRAR
ncbi:hypothetical protein N0X72_13640 [Streptomyces carpaticus]|uniref:hypothetical protein n=1 Tax=Streptomyces carpaticus TaxID=285558 RepID=UPI00220574C6|nr:hypothetical protein N0X72_13640 [Streptomyces carpaticus]